MTKNVNQSSGRKKAELKKFLSLLVAGADASGDAKSLETGRISGPPWSLGLAATARS
jgi:hypothetical protein